MSAINIDKARLHNEITRAYCNSAVGGGRRKPHLIFSTRWDGQECVLVSDDDDGTLPVFQGSRLVGSRGEAFVIVGGRAPHKEGSTGRVWTKGEPFSAEYFPGVVGARWITVAEFEAILEAL